MSRAKCCWPLLAANLLNVAASISELTFAIPPSPPANSSETLDPAPVGLSLEFFAFPEYMENVSTTNTCLANLGEAMGTNPAIRIGGTTQDRATYDPSLTSAVSYSVSNSSDAPDSLTFGPSFMDLAGSYNGSVTIGLNRRLDNISNTIAAAKVAVSKIKDLYAIELGNEPNLFNNTDPIAKGNTWNYTADATTQTSWQRSVGKALGDVTSTASRNSTFQAGVFFGLGSFNITELAARERDWDSAGYVKSFSQHYYPQTGSTANVKDLMSHKAIVGGVSGFSEQISAASSLGKSFVFGETNSATQGGAGVSPTYGAALWTLDYVIQAVIKGTKRLYFHQGTIGNCQYCWWTRSDIGTPYYGAYTAALALNGASRITQLDPGNTAYAAYAIYNDKNRPVRVLLYNSDYYANGTRTSVDFTLSGIPARSTTVSALRLTGDTAMAQVDQGGSVSLAGQTFRDRSCAVQGERVAEKTGVKAGGATFTVAASEALLVYL